MYNETRILLIWLGVILVFIGGIYVLEHLLSLIPIIIGVILIGGCTMKANIIPREYYLNAELYTAKDNTYLFIDEEGNYWEWEDDMYIYNRNHVYLLHMDSMNTKEIKDDIILTVWSSGGEEIPTVG